MLFFERLFIKFIYYSDFRIL